MSFLTWRSGVDSLAAQRLNLFFRKQGGRWPTQPSPFLPLPADVPAHIAISTARETVLPLLRSHTLLHFSDASALLFDTQDRLVLPRVLRLRTPRVGTVWSDPSYTDPDQRRALVAGLWQEHAQTLPLADPGATPRATQPAPGTTWSPYARFPDPQALAGVVPTPSSVAIKNNKIMLSEATTRALQGWAMDLFPREAGRIATVLRAPWHPESPLVVCTSRDRHDLPARARKMLVAALPELAQAVGPGFWRESGAPHYLPNTPCISIQMRPTPSAHARLSGAHDWKACLSPRDQEGWARIVAQATTP